MSQTRLMFRSPRAQTLASSAVVTLLFFIVYALTAAPTVTWQHDSTDSAELAAAAFVFGVPHPTGYPLWLLLAVGFLRLPLVGDPAGRLALLSALAAALSCGTVTFGTAAFLRASGGQTVALVGGVVAGLTLGTSTGLWNVAVVTETYALHTLLMSLVVTVAINEAVTGWSTLLLGLTMANHVTGIPTALIGLWRNQLPRISQVASLAFVLPGAALYAVLVLRARAHPPLNWGDPETLSALWRTVTGAQYRYLLLVSDVPLALSRLVASIHDLVIQFSWLGWPLALVGLAGTWKDLRLRPWFALIPLYIALPAFYAAAGVEHYQLPLVVFLSLCAGLGIAQLVAGLERGRVRAFIWSGAIAIGLVGSLAIGVHVSSLRGDTEEVRWVRQLLAATPPGAIIQSSTDQETFALWYAQLVLGLRPDVRVVDTRLQAFPWYQKTLMAYELAVRRYDAH
ncbi:MAG: DUF2723 domain-containing protein [Chloroflexi bacterium]|nr:DUF2723 domain-containing protein [Chloroflexota bacterium]